MKTVELNKKISRPLDRQKLNLKPKYKESNEESGEESGEIDGVNLKKLIEMINNEESISGQIVNYLYEHGSMTVEKLKERMDYENTDKVFINNLHNGSSNKSQYGKLWSIRDTQVSLNKNIIKYIDKIEGNQLLHIYSRVLHNFKINKK